MVFEGTPCKRTLVKVFGIDKDGNIGYAEKDGIEYLKKHNIKVKKYEKF